MAEETEFPFTPADFPDPHQDPDFDRSVTDYMLSLTPAQRLAVHDEAREFFELAREARIKFYGFDPAASEEAE